MAWGTRNLVVLALAGTLGGCARGPALPEAPAPAACDLASFEGAPGEELAEPKTRREMGSEPGSIRLDRSIAEAGAWVDAGSGWRAWRYWIRRETARSIGIRIAPFDLPPGAEFWLCSPDRTTRRGPVKGRGLGDVGAYRSPEVPGPELWLEVLAPAGAEGGVSLVLVEAFAAPQ